MSRLVYFLNSTKDVIKTRMQADGVIGEKKYKNFLHCYHVTKLEGSLIGIKFLILPIQYSMGDER